MNQQIKLGAYLMGWARSGIKTQTSRLGRRDIQLGCATLVNPHDGCDTIDINVISVEYKLFGHLDYRDADKEGYKNVTALERTLKRIYPNIDPWDEITLITWKTSK